jgi:putative FmdB family regulatory protein
MPVYEYQCEACGQVEEAFQKISEPPLEACSSCKGHLKKLISQSSFHLKGSGWYVTDYGGAKSGGNTGSGGGAKEKSADNSAKTASKSGTSNGDTK